MSDLKKDSVIAAARLLLADVRARYPGQRLRCPYMHGLAVALGELDSLDSEQSSHIDDAIERGARAAIEMAGEEMGRCEGLASKSNRDVRWGW